MSLNLFKKEVERTVGSDVLLASLSDWLGVMAYLEQVATTRMPGLTVVLDEFPYLCETDPALLSIFQKSCDGLRDRGSHLNLILCGSKISFMEELLGEKTRCTVARPSNSMFAHSRSETPRVSFPTGLRRIG
jgi:uncharacterized protein